MTRGEDVAGTAGVPAEREHLFAPSVVANPYPYYADLRARDGAVHSPALNAWLVSRHADVFAAFRAHDLLSSAPPGGSVAGSRFLLTSDPPEHTSMRRVVNRFFSADPVRALEGRVREVTAALVDDMIAAGDEGDVVTHVAAPLPMIVIAELLGVPTERRHDFKRWSDATVGGVDLPPRELAVASWEMGRYFAEVVEERVERPGTDLISRLVQAGGDLTRQEIQAFCTLLLIAGNETTTNLIGNMVLALLTHPEQAERLRAEPGLAAAAVEETLRWDAPVQAVWRIARDDVPVGRTVVPAGARVLLLQGSANRDPERFPDPDAFTVGRSTSDHVGFGTGIHFCLGTQLARLEARVVLETLHERVGRLHRRGPVDRPVPPTAERSPRGRPRVRRHPVVRGAHRIPVTATPV